MWNGMSAVSSSTPSLARLMSKRVGAVGVPKIVISFGYVNPIPNPWSTSLIIDGIVLNF